MPFSSQQDFRNAFQKSKHKIFISYYHYDDEFYRKEFEKLFGHLLINKSVEPGDIDDDNSDDYIRRLIQEDYVSDASVVVVLVGPKTYCRKHVDWEIAAGLNKKVGGYSGLLGICLPEHPDFQKDNFTEKITPPRLVDNINSGYAKYYDWITDSTAMNTRIEEAFQRRANQKDKIINSSAYFKRNLCD